MNERHEMELMDAFISTHADKYELASNQNDPAKKHLYVRLAALLIDKRIKFEYAAAAHDSAQPSHRRAKSAVSVASLTRQFSLGYSLLVCQCIRILSRDEELCAQMLQRDLVAEALVLKFNLLARVCIHGEFQHDDSGPMLEQNGSGPNGSGPIANSQEMVCDILTEVISTIFKMHCRLSDKIDHLRMRRQKELEDTESKQVSAAKAVSQMNLSQNSDDIPEQIDKLTDTEIDLQQ